jgi:chemotaxis methyl-accepting protein methylase
MINCPNPVDVYLPYIPNDTVRAGRIPIFTTLFRSDCFLADALEQTYARNPDAADYTILSAACSIGASADSLMAIHNKDGNSAALNVLGLDVNPKVIRAAKTGRYKFAVRDTDSFRKRMPHNIQSLRDYGFLGALEDSELLPADPDQLEFNSDDVRRGHNVDFEVADLSASRLPDIKADLIEATNVLYHLSPSQASKVVVRLAGLLSDEGVLNLSGEHSAVFKEAIVKALNSGQTVRRVGMMDYPVWQAAMASYLEQQFGLKRIDFKADGPFMFSRVQLD